MPRKNIVVLNSQPLVDIDGVMERDRFLENYDMTLPDDFDREHHAAISRMSRGEKQAYTAYVRQAREHLAQQQREQAEEERSLREQAREHHEYVVAMHKSIRENDKEVERLRREREENLESGDWDRVDVLDEQIETRLKGGREMQQTMQHSQRVVEQSNRRGDELRNQAKYDKQHPVSDRDINASYHLTKGTFGNEMTLLGSDPRLDAFTQQKLGEITLPPGAERRTPPTMVAMERYTQTDPAVNGGGAIWPRDANGDMDWESSRKEMQKKMGELTPGQRLAKQVRGTIRSTTVEVDPVQESWKQDIEGMRRDPQHRPKAELLKAKPYLDR